MFPGASGATLAVAEIRPFIAFEEDEMFTTDPGTTKRRWLRRVTMVAATAAVVAPTAVWAVDSFPDVADGNTHHDNIAWLSDNGITSGCGDGTNFCPGDAVNRQQMATFMRNLAGHVVAAGVSVEHTLGNINVVRSFNNVNDVAPSVTFADGIYTVDFGFDVSDSVVQCTNEGIASTADRTCSVDTAAVNDEVVRVSVYDVSLGDEAEARFNLAVVG